MTMVSDPRFEARDPRFEPAQERPIEPPAGRNPWTTCLIGCLVVALLAMLLFAAAGFWVWRNWRNLAATGAAEAMNQMIDTTGLPAQERQEMKAEVRRVAEAFREGRLSNQQLMVIVENVMHSPLLTLFVASAVDKQYLEKSGLSEDEKAQGRLTLQRFIRGAVDGEINQQRVDAVMRHIAERQPDGNWQLRERVSDADLRAALAEAKAAADEAQVPQQPETVDPSDEFKRIVDEAMAEP